MNKWLHGLGPVREIQASCVVTEDDSSVVRHAAPLDAQAAAQMREQAIARPQADPVAVAARERRIAIDRGKVREIRRWGTR